MCSAGYNYFYSTQATVALHEVDQRAFLEKAFNAISKLNKLILWKNVLHTKFCFFHLLRYADLLHKKL